MLTSSTTNTKPPDFFSERFQEPSGTIFSDEGDFTFSEALFKGTLHEDLNRASPSKGFNGGFIFEREDLKGTSSGLHLRKASSGFEGGLKGASRWLE